MTIYANRKWVLVETYVFTLEYGKQIINDFFLQVCSLILTMQKVFVTLFIV